MPTLKQLAGEAIGTFGLVFIGCGAMAYDEVTGGRLGHPLVALSWGLAVCLMIYAFGKLSGAHINPAVTLGFWAQGCIKFKSVPPYLCVQFIGAIAAAGLLRLLLPTSEFLGASLPRNMSQVWLCFGLEFVLTLILMLVILLTATGPRANLYLIGLLVGATVGFEAFFAGPTCGASMNPARSLGPAVVSGQIQALWAYLLATPLGALMAVPLFRALKPRQADPAVCCGGATS